MRKVRGAFEALGKGQVDRTGECTAALVELERCTKEYTEALVELRGLHGGIRQGVVAKHRRLERTQHFKDFRQRVQKQRHPRPTLRQQLRSANGATRGIHRDHFL